MSRSAHRKDNKLLTIRLTEFLHFFKNKLDFLI